MLVNGGRSGWAWVVSLATSFGVVGLLGTAACGSRTSMLDPDGYGLTDGDSGGSSGGRGSGGTQSSVGSAGKASKGGGLVGNSGATSTPSGGASTGVNPGLALTPCQQYCPAYGTQCKKRLDGKDCMATCQGELNSYGPSCQSMGIEALRCLTPFFTPNGNDCNGAVNKALSLCGPIVTAFDECKENVSSPSRPAQEVFSCPRSGDGGRINDCTSVYQCSNGPYIVFCSTAPNMLLNCSCVPPNGSLSSATLAISSDPCFDAAKLCP